MNNTEMTKEDNKKPYIVIESWDVETLQEGVNEHIALGYLPIGCFVAAIGKEQRDTKYYQPMMLESYIKSIC